MCYYIDMIITHVDLENYTDKIYTESQRKQLDRLCTTVENLFTQMTGGAEFSTLVTDEHVKIIELDNEDRIYLPGEIESIVSLEYLSDNDPETWTTYDEPFLVRGKYISLYVDVSGEFKVTYQMATASEVVKQALIEWVMLIHSSRMTQGRQTSSEGRGTTTNNYMMIESLPVFIKQVIEAHRIYHV